VLQYSRMWLSLVLSVVFFSSILSFSPLKQIAIAILVLLPFQRDLFTTEVTDHAEYVLSEQEYFMVVDFALDGNTLSYDAIGKNGLETEKTTIQVDSFDEESCVIKDDQILFRGVKITDDPSLKKKPVLVNDSDIFYLTDANSRRGVFTLKKIKVPG